MTRNVFADHSGRLSAIFSERVEEQTAGRSLPLPLIVLWDFYDRLRACRASHTLPCDSHAILYVCTTFAVADDDGGDLRSLPRGWSTGCFAVMWLHPTSFPRRANDRTKNADRGWYLRCVPIIQMKASRYIKSLYIFILKREFVGDVSDNFLICSVLIWKCENLLKEKIRCRVCDILRIFFQISNIKSLDNILKIELF